LAPPTFDGYIDGNRVTGRMRGTLDEVTEAAATEHAGHARLGGILLPLAGRDFRIYWIGQSISLVGDGIYLVERALSVPPAKSPAVKLP